MNKFEYRIYNSVYEDMISGKKTIEFRLLNEKSNRIQKSDEIKFEVVDNKSKSVLVEVLDKYFYDDIDDLWNKEDSLKIYTKEELKGVFYQIFGKEKVDSSKIVGIKFRIKEYKNDRNKKL